MLLKTGPMCTISIGTENPSLSMDNHVINLDMSLQAFDSLLRKLQKYVPYGASVADIYAGAGIIGLSLAVTRKCR